MPAPQSLRRDRAATGNGCCQAALATTTPRSAADRSRVGQRRAFSRIESDYRTNFGPGEILHPRLIQDFVFSPGIVRAGGRRVKKSGNTAEMPLEEVCCCFPKIPGLKAESIGGAI